MCALRCPNGRGHGVRALLLPRVYLQTVTLMQCNDYFYSRYFGSPFTLSGMTPHWPTDYLCGCCHTWLLQLSSLSTITPSEPSRFYYWTFICFSLYHSKSLPILQRLHFYFVWSFSLLQHLHHLLIASFHQSLYLYSSTFSNLAFLLPPALTHGGMKILEGFCRSIEVGKYASV